MNFSKPSSTDKLWVRLRKRLAKSDYLHTYATEMDFESDVWAIVVDEAVKMGLNSETACLTSHATNSCRSSAAWKKFCDEELGPDVNVLGSNNRLDIIVRHPKLGSIGIEVKCLGAKGHAAKLTQGIGQAVLALALRDRTLLIIHCGKVSYAERQWLREISKKMCRGMRTAVVVVPQETHLSSKEKRGQELAGSSTTPLELASKRTGWRWQEGAVDPNGEHIEIRYGDASTSCYEEWTPITLIGNTKGHLFSVRWLREPPAVATTIIGEVRRELDFYLVDKCEPAPWEYAIYHCNTGANTYSKVHWSYFPTGQHGEKHSRVVVQLTAEDATQLFGSLKQPHKQEGD